MKEGTYLITIDENGYNISEPTELGEKFCQETDMDTDTFWTPGETMSDPKEFLRKIIEILKKHRL